MFSPPPSGTHLRRHVRPYKLAPLQREMYIQQTIGDSPFYSSATSMISSESSRFPLPYLSPPGSSVPMLVMTDDGGDAWEVLSEVIYLDCISCAIS